MILRSVLLAALLGVVLAAVPAALGALPEGEDLAKQKLGARHAVGEAVQTASNGVVATNFEVLGHHDLGLTETNGDVWVHGNFAYVGTWRDPCNGRGVKIIDVTDLGNPQLIGTLAAREGTSAEDMKVVRVSTPFFAGDLMAVGIQRCGDDPALDEQEFGLQLWDVTNPHAPVFFTEFGVGHGAGGVHELDLFQRGNRVYALLAHPFGEWFDPAGHGDFMIVDVTNPNLPVMTADWGAGANSFSPGPFWGQGGGNFAATFGHSARASRNGKKAYVSYWDLGVLTFDIRDVTNPRLLTRTRYPSAEDEGDAHSMTPYANERGRFILQNDEDFDARSVARVRAEGVRGLAAESPGGSALWLEPGHRLTGPVVMAANQGCEVGDYPGDTAGKIAVVRTPFPFFDPGFDPATSEQPLCDQHIQAEAAAVAGAAAVVHDFIAEATSPQWFDFSDPPLEIPVLFTDHTTAQGIVAAGQARLRALRPTWGFLRVFDAETGRQVAKFDGAPNVSALPPPDGFWSIHNTEVVRNRAYSSWYSNGVVALNLRPLNRRNAGDPRMVGQFVPEAAPGGFPGVWGVVIRPSDRIMFVSDEGSGLWIVRATGPARPGGED